MMGRLFYLFILLSIFSFNQSFAAQTKTSAATQETYKDIKQTLGILPTFMKEYPDSAISGAWMEMKGLQLNPASVIPGKFKELIGLGISAQIPCRYCTHFHTETSKLHKATTAEMKEALAVSAITHRWGAFLTGAQIDMNTFRGDVDKMLSFRNKQRNLQAMEAKPTTAENKINTAEDVYRDVKEHYGFVPNFISEYPKSAVVGAWHEMKAIELNADSAIPAKYRNLIGLGISAQTSCQYCIYYHTQAAIQNGATKEELMEASALAGGIRHWSTIINGQMIDEKQFRNEVAQMIKHLKSKMGKEVGLSR